MIGQHLFADLYGIEPSLLKDGGLLADCLQEAAKRCGLHPIGAPKMHAFPGGGVTGVLLLSESHIALHTYPEHGYLALDIFSCGHGDPSAALEVFREALNPSEKQVTLLVRGERIRLCDERIPP
jgi:S-adenosylmethionine decarboxylase